MFWTGSVKLDAHILQVIPRLDVGGAERTTVDVSQAIIGAGGSPFGLGGDIGGSIRNPAFFCGVT
ncbi:MAG: amidase family protein, partial [Pseudomonadota bacterium]